VNKLFSFLIGRTNLM